MDHEVERPLILVTNDDGIMAQGIATLAQHLESVGDVFVVAPDQEQSACGHSISLTRPMRITPAAPGRFAISGSPADSVLVALFHLCPRPPSLVVSGINLGVNVGTDVFYSGTLAGALEGAIHGIPAIAISQDVGFADTDPDTGPTLDDLLERTGEFAAIVARRVLDSGMPARTALSINAPLTLSRDYCWTRLGRRIYREMVEQRLDLRGQPYYWVGGPVVGEISGPGTDAHAVEQGLISMTLLGLDMTVDPPDQYQEIALDGYRRRPATIL